MPDAAAGERRQAPERAPGPVRLSPAADVAELQRLAADAQRAAGALQEGDVAPALALAAEEGRRAPVAGSLTWFERLASLGAVDLSVARVVEPHVDALQILAEAGDPDLGPVGATDASTWGVFAAEGPGHAMTAREADGGWVISGSKPWCSLAGELSHALVTARLESGDRGLFAVALDGAETDPSGWHARGLEHVVSTALTLSERRAVPVGGPQWYLIRPGFWWGGIGVAAVWFGGAVGVARRLAQQSMSGREPDQVAQLLVGRCSIALEEGRLLLVEAARRIEAGAFSGDEAQELACRTRHGIHDVAESVLRYVGHGCGPAPLAVEEEHARRVADLEVYLRQDHAERDEAALGRAVLAGLENPNGWYG